MKKKNHMYNKISTTKGVKCYNENKAASVVSMDYLQETKYDLHNNDLLQALQISKEFLIQEMSQKNLRIHIILPAFFDPRNEEEIWNLFKISQLRKS